MQISDAALASTDPTAVGVLGASSFVGRCVLELLTQAGRPVVAFSRKPAGRVDAGVQWRSLTEGVKGQRHQMQAEMITCWVTVCPIAAVPQYFDMMQNLGVQRLVALSSTSRFTRADSSSPLDTALAAQFAESEAAIEAWAMAHQVQWIVLRPTLIYGLAQDKNISDIVRFVRRFGFFPLMGRATGLRQPIHAQDVAGACVAALSSQVSNRAYNLSGAETLPYRDMVKRVFQALQRPARLLPLPAIFFAATIAVLRFLPRFKKWSPSMAQRMNRDQVFDHSDATRDLAFKPQAFVLADSDLNQSSR